MLHSILPMLRVVPVGGARLSMDQEILTRTDPTPQTPEASAPRASKQNSRRTPIIRKAHIRRNSLKEGGRMLVKDRPKQPESVNTEALLNTLKAFRKGDFS